MFRLLETRRVPWVLLENVVGLLDRTGSAEPAVSFVASHLERLGYAWAQRVVAAAPFGLPQRRRRVFLVASLWGDPRDVLLSQNYVCLGACATAFGSPCAECFACAGDVAVRRGAGRRRARSRARGRRCHARCRRCCRWRCRAVTGG